MLGSYESAGQHKSFLVLFFHKASRGPYILHMAVVYNARTNGTTDCSARLQSSFHRVKMSTEARNLLKSIFLLRCDVSLAIWSVNAGNAK